MALLRWEDKFLIGHEIIDRDHQMLFALINAFYDGFLQTKSRRELAGLLTKLVQYAEAHFRREEAIMHKCDYVLLGEHQLSHAKLYEAIYALNEKVVHDTAPLDKAAVAFLKNWLVDHVIDEDTKLGEFLRAQQQPS